MLLVFVSLLLFEIRDFSQTNQNPISISNIHKVLALVFASIFTLTFFLLRGLPKQWAVFQTGFLLYVLLGVLSSLVFSSNVFFSLWKLLEVSTVLMLSLYVLTLGKKTPFLASRFYELCLLFFKFMLIVTAIGALIYPNEAIHSPLSDESMAVYGAPLLPYQIFGTILQINSNSLGAMSAILLFVYAHKFMTGNRSFSIVSWGLFSLTFLILSQSRTAFIGLFCALAVTLIVDANQRRTTKLFLIFIFTLLVTTSANILVEYLTRGVDQERLATLSGRMIWWEVAFEEYLNADVLAQIIGMGFGTASRTILDSKLDQGGAATLHSDYIDALVSTGILGLMILIIIMVALLIEAYKYAMKVRDPIAIEMLGIIIILFVRSFSGTTIATHNIFLILIFSIAVYLRIEKSRPRLHLFNVRINNATKTRR